MENRESCTRVGDGLMKNMQVVSQKPIKGLGQMIAEWDDDDLFGGRMNDIEGECLA